MAVVFACATETRAALTDWQVNGDAWLSGDRIYLTPDQDDQAGSALYKGKINLTVDFEWHMRVNLGTHNSSGADGLSLLFHNDPGGGIFASGITTGGGEWIGTNGIYPAVVIEIDTWENTTRGDPSCDHVGIHTYPSNGSGTPNHNAAGPACALSSGNNIETGNEYDFDVYWNATTDTLTVYFNDVLRLTYSNDIVSNVFGGTSQIYMGWTGSTGGSSNVQYVIVDSIGPMSEIGIGKTISTTTPSVGERITYTVTATNNGTSDASGITVTDTLPTQLTFFSATPSQGTYDSGTGIWTVGALNSGSAATLALNATVNSVAIGTVVSNTATMGNLDQFDSDFSNNTATVNATTAGVNVSVAKAVSPGSVPAGATVTYTVTLTNSGAGNAAVSSIEDTLPAGFTYVMGSTSGGVAADPAVASQTLTWSGYWVVPKKTGAVDGTLVFSFQATAGSTNGVFNNNVTAVGPALGTVSTGDTAPVTVTVPVLDLIKSTSSANAMPGDEVTYSVKFHNTGSGTALNAEITDMIPADTTYVAGSMRLGAAGSNYASATPLTDAADADEGELSGSTVIFTIDSLDPDDSVADSGTDEGVVFFKVTIN